MAKQKFYETAEFKKIQKEWVQKLKDSGFEDSEYFEDYQDELLIKPKIIEPMTGSRVLTGNGAVYNKYVTTTRKMVNGVPTLVETKILDADHYQFCHRLLRELDFKLEFDTKAQLRGEVDGLSKGERNKIIFELHTEGLGQHEIVDELLKVYELKITQQAVSLIIDTVKARFIEIERG